MSILHLSDRFSPAHHYRLDTAGEEGQALCSKVLMLDLLFREDLSSFSRHNIELQRFRFFCL